MIEVEITRDGQAPRRVRLADGAFRLGRHEDNDIVLDGREVSRHHARLLLDGSDVVIEDLSSGNGVLVAGRLIRDGLVAEGDVIQIATFELSYHHVVPEVDGEAVLLAMDGDDVGRRWPLQGECLSIGRGDDADVLIDDPGVSRHHADLVRRAYGWSIRDNGSANGLYLNDQRLREAPLRSGDILRIGTLRFRFVIKAPEAGPEARTGQGEATVILRRDDLGDPASAPPPPHVASPKVRTQTTASWWAYLLLGVVGAGILVGLLWVAQRMGVSG